MHLEDRKKFKITLNAINTLKSFNTSSAIILKNLFRMFVCPKLISKKIQVLFLFKKDNNKVESLQRKFTRFICSSCTNPIHHLIGILSKSTRDQNPPVQNPPDKIL